MPLNSVPRRALAVRNQRWRQRKIVVKRAPQTSKVLRTLSPSLTVSAKVVHDERCHRPARAAPVRALLVGPLKVLPHSLHLNRCTPQLFPTSATSRSDNEGILNALQRGY